MNIAIVGIGNILLSDEGVGVHAMNCLKDTYSFDQEIDFIDGGTMGLDLLPFIEGRDLVIILDAVDFKKEPGYIQTIEKNELPIYLTSKFSVHQIALPDLLAATKLIAMPPKDIILVGIQPETIDVGTELSKTITNRLPDLIQKVTDVLESEGIHLGEKPA